MTAIAEANGGHQVSYGEDDYTDALRAVIRNEFGSRAEVFPVFNGTGANVVALTSLMPRWGAAIVTESAHVHTDEGGAPERVSGIKLLTVPTPDGKLTPELIATEAYGWGFEHRAQPAVVSLTQVTELGTLYTPAEIAANADFAHRNNMALHVDGARLWNAAATLQMPMGRFTTDVGVDIVSLGATKVGALGAEAIVVIDPDRVDGLIYLRKLSMQLASKMRFISAQLLALFEDGTGLHAAAHANAMAARLRAGLEGVPGLRFAQSTESNAVFAVLDRAAAERVRESWRFYDWAESGGPVRWMCSFDTTDDDVDRFIETIRKELAR